MEGPRATLGPLLEYTSLGGPESGTAGGAVSAACDSNKGAWDPLDKHS